MDPESVLAIFGLGNPGLGYRYTRHNAGFLFLDYLVRREDVTVLAGKRKYDSRLERVHLFGRTVHLIKPQTFMNLSGEAFTQVLDAYHLTPRQTMVIYDDLDLPFGTFRIRARGSSGGHRGMESIIRMAGTSDIPRLRIGITGEAGYDDAVEYVLGEFTNEERQTLPRLFSLMGQALESVLVEGVDAAMTKQQSWRLVSDD